MKLWTLKEAVVKSKGTGINAPPGLKGFSIGKLSLLSISMDVHPSSFNETVQSVAEC